MLVNNIDISTCNAILLSKNIETADVVTYDDWLRNALNPLYMGKQEQYKKITIELFIQAENDEDALMCISNLVKQLGKCVIKFDDLDFYYDCIITSKSQNKITTGIYTIDVELKSGYAYTALVAENMNDISSKTIDVDGNANTTAIVTLMVPVDTISVTISGLSDDSITIKNLKANVPVVIDGEACTVLQNGANKYGDTDMWEFPILQTGANAISVDNSNCTIQIQYKPKWI